MAGQPSTINEEAGLGPNWVPVDGPPIIPGQIVAAPPASDFVSTNPKYIQGTIAPNFQHDSSFVDTGDKTAHVPKFDLMPLGPQQNAITATQVSSTVKSIVKSIQSTPAPPDVESIFVFQKKTTSPFDAEFGVQTLSPPSNVVQTLTLQVKPTVQSYCFMTCGFQGASPVGSCVTPPGMTAVNGPNNTNVDAQGVFAAGSTVTAVETITYSNSFGNVSAAAGVMAAFPTTGTPATAQIGGSSSANNVALTNGYAAGTTLLIAIFGATTAAASISSFSDTNGNVYRKVAGLTELIGGTYGALAYIFVCPSAVANTAGHSVTYSYPDTFVSGVQFHVYTVTNVNAAGGISYTVTSADQGNLLSFSDNAGGTIVLPTNLPSGFYVYIENTGSGTFSLTSAGQIDGSVSPLTLNALQGVLLVFNGTNWFTCRGTGGLSIPVPVASGGTGAATLAAHGVLIGEGTSAVAVTGAGTSGQPLVSNGASADPTYQTLPVSGGGTGDTTLAAHGVLIGEGTSAIAVTGTGASGQPLVSNGASADPTYQTLPVSGGGTGDTTLTAHGVLIGEGTSPVVATSPGTSGQVLTSNGASADPTFQGAAVQVAVTSLSSVQILALLTTPISLVAAPGVGFTIIPLSISIILFGGSAAYTDAGGAVSFNIGSATQALASNAIFTTATSPNKQIQRVAGFAATDTAGNPPTDDNAAMTISKATNNFAAGNGTAKVIVHYVIMPTT